MPFNVTQFNAEMGRAGFARPAYFMMMITLPTALNGKYDTTALPLRIHTASLPGRDLLAADQRYYGPVRKIPYGYQVQQMNFQVILSEDYREREIFSAWQDLMVGSSRTNKSVSTAMFDAGYYKTGTDGASVEVHAYATSPKLQSKTNQGPNIITQARKAITAIGYDPSKLISKVPTIPGLPSLSSVISSREQMPIESACTVQLIEPYPINIADMPLSWGDDTYASLNVTMQYRYFTEKNYYTDISASNSGLNSAQGLFARFKPILSTIQSNYSRLNTYARQAKDIISAFKQRN